MDEIIEKARYMVYSALTKKGIDPMKVDTSWLITQTIAILQRNK